MSVYTVHAPPRRTADAKQDAAGFVFVRDGFAIWAFLLPPLWMLWHRMWLALAGYIAISAALQALGRTVGASAALIGIVGVLVSLLIGLEAATLRRYALSSRGWRTVGVVSGDDLEAAERRFFDSWARRGAAAPSAVPVAAPPAGPATAVAAARTIAPQSDIIGLFPEPGG